MKHFFLGLIALTISLPALAKDCSYESFTPEFLESKVLYDFTQAGFGEIPFRTSNEKGVQITKTTIVRDFGAVGTVELQVDRKNLKSHFAIQDVRGRNLLSVVQELKGVSRTEIDFYSDLNSRAEFPFLTILHFPAGGTFHYVGVKDEGITAFYIEFNNIWNEAKKVLLAEDAPTYYFFKSPREKFLFRLQNNPELSPYAKYLSVVERGKSFVVVGVVPSNGVYYEVLRLVQDELGMSARVDLTIDQRIQAPLPVKPVCKPY